MGSAIKQKNWMVGAGLALALTLPYRVHAQEGVGDVIYVPTPQKVVEAMLKMVKIGPKDFIIDLGSGDGRMVITAAREFGARGVGIDLDTAETVAVERTPHKTRRSEVIRAAGDAAMTRVMMSEPSFRSVSFPCYAPS